MIRRFLSSVCSIGPALGYSVTLSKGAEMQMQVDSRNEIQHEAIEAALRELNKESRAQVIMPCGTGKTRVGLRVMEGLRVKRTIVFCPSLELIKQTIDVYLQNRRHEFSVICVCSDENTVAAAKWQYGIDAPTTTDPQQMRRILQEGNGRVVVFATYQSADKVAEAMQGTDIRFGLAIFDEAHHTAGVSDSDRVFSFGLLDEKIPASSRLFLTATPRILQRNERAKAKRDAAIVSCMDDAGIFGRVAYRLDFAEAIERQVICPYMTIVFNAPSSLLEEVRSDGTHAELTARAAAVLLSMQKYGIRKLFAYSSTVERSRLFVYECQRLAGVLSESGILKSEQYAVSHVDGWMSMRERKEILERFREDNESVSILSNCKVLSEGVDAPDVDGVAFVDPKSSTIDIIQSMGRCLRLAPGKHVGSVIVPVFLPDDEKIRRTSYDGVLRVVDALRAHDSRIERAAIQYSLSVSTNRQKRIDIGFNVEQVEYDGLSAEQCSEIHPRVRSAAQHVAFSRKLIIDEAKRYLDDTGKRPSEHTSEFFRAASKFLRYHFGASLKKLLDDSGLGQPLRILHSQYAVDLQKKAMEFFEAHGRWPTCKDKSGRWSSVDKHLRSDGTSLSKWLIENGLKEDRCRLTENEWIERARKFVIDAGRLPTKRDYAGGWGAFDARLRSIGKTLSKWLNENGIQDGREDLTNDAIIQKAIEFFDRHGRWPSLCDKSEGWGTINSHLLRRGSSLAKLKNENGLVKRGTTNEERISDAKRFREQHGRWPSVNDTEAGWRRFDGWLKWRGSSLAKWKKENGLVD